jgi:urease accessory protein
MNRLQMLIVDRILGRADAPEFARRRVERVSVAAIDAGRRRMRVRSDRGADVAVDLRKPAWLFDGAVLHDDGQRILVVMRPAEAVMVIGLATLTPEAAFRIGHALGNRHSPSEWRGDEVVVPVSDTPDLTARPVLALGLAGLALRFEQRPFAADAPPTCGGGTHEHLAPRHEHHGHEPSARPPEGGLAPARREGAERQGCTNEHPL